MEVGVAQRAVAQDLALAQDAIQPGSQPLDAGGTVTIEVVRPELHGGAPEPVEGVARQQSLAIRVERRTLPMAGRRDRTQAS